MPRIIPADLPRLRDCIRPGVTVLFVGINPGVRSSLTVHHFAGFSNRFWKLLFESGLVPEAIGHQDDGRLPEFGYGITNLIARASPGINDLRPIEYVEGWKILERKIRKYRPQLVALIGVTLYRAILPLLGSPRPLKKKYPDQLGAQSERNHGARIF